MKHTFKSCVSIVLAFAIVMSIVAMMPFAAFAANDYTLNSTTSTDGYYNLISKKDWDIAPGITESEIVLNNDAGTRRQVLFVMEADMNNEYVKATYSYTGMIPQYGSYTTGVMSKQAAWAEANGYGNVVGAMNTCLSWYTGYSPDRVGEPLGFMMLDAEIVFDPGNCGYTYGNVGFPSVVVINKDFDENGNPRPADIPKVEMPQIRTAADLDGWEDQVIPCSSGYIVKDGINQYANKVDHSDDAPRSVVGIKPDGTVVIMLNDGRQAPYSVGMSMYELAEVMLDLGCSFAVNCDGGGSSTYLSQRPGEELKVNNSPSDGAERATTSGIFFISTAPANGEFYKAHVSTESDYYTPNSAVQFNAIGTDMVGGEAEIPAEAQWVLADATMGEIDNNGLFLSNGKEGEVGAQLVYNGKVVGESTITIVTPEIRFKNDTIVIGYGDSTPIPIEVTTNEGRNEVAYKEGDIVYTLSDENLGTIVGGTFTACDENTGLTGGTLTAVLLGQTDKAITAEIRFGKASEIVYDFENGEFIYDEDPGVAPAEGESYGWAIMDTRRASYHGYRYYSVNSNYTPVTYDIDAKLYLADANTGLVRNGNGSMGVDIRWTNTTSSCHGQMLMFLPDPIVLTDATSFGYWIYIPSEMVTASMEFKAYVRTTEGKTSAVTHKVKDLMAKNTGVDNGGWYYVSWDVLDHYTEVRYFEINSHYQAVEGNYNYYQNLTYYIDDITVDYSDATIDRENPYFTSMTIADEYTNGVEINGQTITTNTIDLMAQAYENTAKVNATGLDRNSVKLYVDGVLSNAPIQISAAGTIGVSGLYLNDGAHTLLMEIRDNQGNIGTIVRKLVVNTEKSAVRLEVNAEELLPTGSIVWANLVAEDLASIESVTTTVTLDYVNEWELDYMEVAYGFEAEYYIDHNHNAVITFTRTGTEIADTDILAKLPIRIWMARGWMDDSGIRAQYISNDPAKQDKYMILAPHAMWYSDGTYDYRLVVGAEAGLVNYVDGSSITFSALNTVIRTEMNRYYTNTNKQNKWAFHICVPGEAQSKAATCTEPGYENRVYCVGCACETVENLGHECDNHAGCGSPIEWGTTIPALGHTYEMIDGKLACVNGGELFNGIHTDGKTYVDGVAMADGWNAEGTAYYVDGVALTGSHFIDGAMYTFDEKGVYLPDYLYEGFYETADGKTMYFINNSYITGLNRLNDNYYNFDNNGYAWEGVYELCGYACTFEKGVFVKNETVTLAGLCGDNVVYVMLADGRMILEGEGPTFDFSNVGLIPWYDWSIRSTITSIYVDKDITTIGSRLFYNLDHVTSVTFEEGSKLRSIKAYAMGLMVNLKELTLPEGIANLYGYSFMKTYYLKNLYVPESVTMIGATAFNEVKDITFTVIEGSYAEQFAQSKGFKYISIVPVVPELKNGIVLDEDGELRYYIDDVAQYAGLVQDEDGTYYYFGSNKRAKKDCYYGISKTNGLLPAGGYWFDKDGKLCFTDPNMKQGIVMDEDGEIRYYIDGVAQYAGLVQDADGNYYYFGSNNRAKRDCYYGISKTNGLLPAGGYWFDKDGKLLFKNPNLKQGVVMDDDGEIRYYIDGVAQYAGLVLAEDGHYYYFGSNNRAKRDCYYGISKTNGLLPAGGYWFDKDGKLLFNNPNLKQGIIMDEDGEIRYYIDGVAQYAGLVQDEDGNYYYFGSNKKAKRDCYYGISKTNGLLPAGGYTFGADGKIVF